jgi:hypothetical protein
MKRTYAVTVAGKELSFPVNFAALDTLARSGIDPGKIVREKQLTLRDAVEAIGVGMRMAGEKGTNDELVIGKVAPAAIGETAIGWCVALVEQFATEDKTAPKAEAPST